MFYTLSTECDVIMLYTLFYRMKRQTKREEKGQIFIIYAVLLSFVKGMTFCQFNIEHSI